MKWGVIVLAVVAFALGRGCAPELDQPVKVITKERTVTETETVVKVDKVIPESCRRAYTEAIDIDRLIGAAYAGLNTVESAIQDGSVALGAENPQMMVAAREQTSKALNATRGFRLEIADSRGRIERYLQTCNEELKHE